MAKYLDFQILANRFVLKLKLRKNSSAIFLFDIVLMVMKSQDFARHLGQYPHLNTTCGNSSADNFPSHFSDTIIATLDITRYLTGY